MESRQRPANAGPELLNMACFPQDIFKMGPQHSRTECRSDPQEMVEELVCSSLRSNVIAD